MLCGGQGRDLLSEGGGRRPCSRNNLSAIDLEGHVEDLAAPRAAPTWAIPALPAALPVTCTSGRGWLPKFRSCSGKGG